MKRNLILDVILALALLLYPQAKVSQVQQTHSQAPATIHDFGASRAAGSNTIFLPLLATPPGPPDFEITSPADGWTVSGMMYVAAQARDPETVTSVTFSAGSTVLGTDDTPADGFRVFFDASAFPAGDVVLTAVAAGPSGQTSKTVTVNVLPNPPSSGTIGAQGGVLASEIGSIITIPPHALPQGTQLTVDELTQQEVTAQNGIDWEAMGVTFLGAQDIQSTAPFSQPYRVASADFGNRVQPGQAVVNYQIVPDADGDGVDEIVVVNTASVAPNNDVISDPIPQVLLEDEVVVANANRSSFSVLGLGSIQGPPGTIIEIDATGFNPFSVAGNTAVFHSMVNNTEVQMPVVLSPDLDEASSAQTLSVIIPMLLPGPATLSFHNESTGDITEPMMLMVEEAAPITRPPDEIIDDFFSQSLIALRDIEASAGEDEDLDTLIAEFTEVELIFEQLSHDSSPEVQQFLTEAATLIENSGILEATQSGTGALLRTVAGCFTKMQLKVIRSLALIGIALTTIGCGILFTPLGGALCGAALTVAYGLIEIWFLADSECSPPTPPSLSCPASQTSASGTTGMGSAPPPGGNGCGNVIGAGSGNGRSPQGTGDVVIKIFSGGSPTPFSGVVDPGGYFFIPFIPAGAPFTAVAHDLTTGETRVVDGIGPALGDFEFMVFDFFSEPAETDTITWDGGGDGTSWHDANNWSGDVVPNAADDVLIDVPGNITVTHSFGSHAVRSLHSEEAILLTGGTLDMGASSILSQTLALMGGSLSGNGDLTLNGLLLWRQGNMSGLGTTTANGDIHFIDNVNRALLEGRTLINSGTAVWQNGYLIASPGTTIINMPDATFDFQGDFVNGISGGADTLFHNMGTVIKAAGSGPGIIGTTFNNSGIVEIQDGNFIIQGNGGTHSGTFQGTGTLEIRGRTHVLNGSISNLNVLLLSDPTTISNTLFINGTYDAISTIVTGDNATVYAALHIGAGVTAHSETFTLDGGSVTGDGDLVVSGPTTWNMGTMSGDGTTTAMGGLTFAGFNTRVLDGRTLVNSGTAVFEDGWFYINNGGLLHNTNTATWDFIGDDVVSTNVGGGTFQNDGSLTKSAGSGTATIGATFINNGDVSVQSGALQFGGDFTQTANGTLFVQIGGLIPITEFDQYNITGAATLDGTLDVTLTGSFTPNPGDSFAVMTFVSHTGQFAAVNGHGQNYTINYNAANVTLTAQ